MVATSWVHGKCLKTGTVDVEPEEEEVGRVTSPAAELIGFI